MVEVLATNTALRGVRFSACDNSACALDRIGTLLARNTMGRLVSLDLSDTPLTIATIMSLQETPRFRVFLAARCRLGDRELNLLFQKLPRDTLQTLDLSGNKFGVESSHALAVFVAQTKALKRLIVSQSNLTVEALFEAKHGALEALSRLEELDFSKNNMQSFGGQYSLQLISLTAMLTAMRKWSFADTNSDALLVICPTIGLLLSNPNVHVHLDISGTRFENCPDKLQKSLQTAVSRTLRHLDLSSIGVKAPELR